MKALGYIFNLNSADYHLSWYPVKAVHIEYQGHL